MDYSVSGKKWQGIYYNPLEGNIYLVYKRYILPIGQLYKYKYIRYLSLFTRTWKLCWNYAGFVCRGDSQKSFLHKTPTQTMQYFATNIPWELPSMCTILQMIHSKMDGREWYIVAGWRYTINQTHLGGGLKCVSYDHPPFGGNNPIWQAHFSYSWNHMKNMKKKLGNLWSAGHAPVWPVFSNQQLEGRFQLVSIKLLVLKPTSCRTLSELSVLFACWVLGARRR